MSSQNIASQTGDQQKTNCALTLHPNGMPITGYRPKLAYLHFSEQDFPDNYLGHILCGIIKLYLLKSCQRSGWLRKGACSDPGQYPNESVASHSWGIAILIELLSQQPQFKEELPEFHREKALSMALIHDVPEVITGDITPVDGIHPDEKHKQEQEAMKEILHPFPKEIQVYMHQVYQTYEERTSLESKFVKDCDKLDFIIYAFLLEMQGFSGFEEFYPNSCKDGFFSKLCSDLAKTLIDIRRDLINKNNLYKKQN